MKKTFKYYMFAALVVAYALGAVASMRGQSSVSSGGAFLPLQDTVVGGVWTYLGASPLKFEGATNDSKATTLTFTDPTANRTWTVPDATDTFVGRATTDTLTNKTLTAPVISPIRDRKSTRLN